MIFNAAQAYQNNSVKTASPGELTLMLYDGAIKFCNIALEAIDNKDIAKAHTNIKKAEDIITELRETLNHNYPVWEDFERVYEYIYRLLVEANMRKDKQILNRALENIRDMRDTWKKVMQSSKGRV